MPRDDVEADLRQSTTAIVGGVTITALVVALFAIWLGSRVIGSMTALQDAARALTAPDIRMPDAPLPIDEAETVRKALHNAAEQLAARDDRSNAALSREAEARTDAERANAAKDEFLAMLGHELRNPLSAMKSAAALLAMPAARPAVHQRSREVIDRQISRLTDLVDDMLDVARLNAGKIVLDRKLVDLAHIVRHVVGSFKDAGRAACICASRPSSSQPGCSRTRPGWNRWSPTCSTTPASTPPPAAACASPPGATATAACTS